MVSVICLAFYMFIQKFQISKVETALRNGQSFIRMMKMKPVLMCVSKFTQTLQNDWFPIKKSDHC